MFRSTLISNILELAMHTIEKQLVFTQVHAEKDGLAQASACVVFIGFFVSVKILVVEQHARCRPCTVNDDPHRQSRDCSSVKRQRTGTSTASVVSK